MSETPPAMIPSYGTYLRLETLLAAQAPPDFAALHPGDDPGARTRPLLHHDELLFIVVHQVFELWFKLVLHELSEARDIIGRRGAHLHLEAVPEEMIPAATAAIQRVNEVFRIAIDHFRLIETMPPTHFLLFRDAIIPASGFQSAQFRELEILAGLPEDLRVDFEGVPYESKLGAGERARLEDRRHGMTLREALLDWLARTPIERVFPRFADAFAAAFARYADDQAAHQDRNPHLAPTQRQAARRLLERQKDAVRAYLLGGSDEQNRAHQAFVFIATYRRAPLLRWPNTLIDAVVEFEQGFRTFRFRHARMVERMIGSRVGSGGSTGVAYLDHTASRYRIFGDLLEARSFLLSPDYAPKLPDQALLGFRFDQR